jgi:hypothetical protein
MKCRVFKVKKLKKLVYKGFRSWDELEGLFFKTLDGLRFDAVGMLGIIVPADEVPERLPPDIEAMIYTPESFATVRFTLEGTESGWVAPDSGGYLLFIKD